jgi:hypothetical protein
MAIDPNAAAAAALGLPTSALSGTSSSSTPSISNVNSSLQNLLTQSQTAIQSAISAQTTAAADAAAAAANAASAGTISGLQSQIAGLQASATTNAAANATNQQNALQLLQTTLAGYGIDTTGAISTAILSLLQKNYDAPTIQAIIQNPTSPKSSDPNIAALANAWNTRFSGNLARETAGLTPLSTADYIATENSYKQVLAAAGLPASATDNAIVGKLMGVDVSPTEVQMRVSAAMTALNSEDPFVIQQLQSQYGLARGTLALHLLDPSLASNVIQQQVNAAQIGAEAARQGTNIAYGGTGPLSAMSLAAQGITQAQAAQGFNTVASQLPATQTLAGRYQGYMPASNAAQALESVQFGTQGAALSEAELKRLQTQEVAQFSGSAGASSQAQSLGIGNAQGVS